MNEKKVFRNIVTKASDSSEFDLGLILFFVDLILIIIGIFLFIFIKLEGLPIGYSTFTQPFTVWGYIFAVSIALTCIVCSASVTPEDFELTFDGSVLTYKSESEIKELCTPISFEDESGYITIRNDSNEICFSYDEKRSGELVNFLNGIMHL